MLNLGHEARVTRVMNAVAAGNNDVQSSTVIDMAGFEAAAFVASLGAIAAGGAATVTVWQGNQPNMADGAPLVNAQVAYTDADDDLVAIIDVGKPMGRYLQARIARAAGGDTTIDGVLALQYRARNAPVVQGATVLGTVVLVSPNTI